MAKSEELIPEAAQQFAREFAELAIKHGLTKAVTTIQFSNFPVHKWDDQIAIVWEAGRHGEDVRRFTISTSLRICGEVNSNG
jgi:hypothetical protein